MRRPLGTVGQILSDRLDAVLAVTSEAFAATATERGIKAEAALGALEGYCREVRNLALVLAAMANTSDHSAR